MSTSNYPIILNMELEEIAEKLNRKVVQRETSKKLLEDRMNRLEEIKNETEVILKSQALLQDVAREVQSKLSMKIDSIVNLGLATCFPEYTFQLRYVPARGKTEVEFVVLLGEDEVDPKLQNGGGLIDLLTFCLRVAIYTISNTDSVILLDEPFKYVSKGLRDKTAELLHTLSERLNLQFIEVTHVDELIEYSDKQFVVKKINGVSYAS